MTVAVLRGQPHVVISSGLVTGGRPELIGVWCHMVAYVDEDGCALHDYIGPQRERAEEAALTLARDFNVRLFDLSRGKRPA